MPEMVTAELMNSGGGKFNKLVVGWNEWFWKFNPGLDMTENAPEQPISWILNSSV